MSKNFKCSFFILLLCHVFSPGLAQTLNADGHSLHYESWNSAQDTKRPNIVLLSGPIDSWHSDSAWWASLGPVLAKTHRVIALDRAGLILGSADAKVGYQHFAQDLALVFAALQIKDAIVVAFASSNISLQLFLAQHPQQQAIKQVIMIDPDVLTAFSIARYKNDASPFKQNLSAYTDYVNAGKYTARTGQKNVTDLAQLKTLSADAQTVDWAYVDKLQRARLEIENQLNLFNEIAIYDEDLDAVAKTQWPASIPLVVIDTDFEAEYIDAEQDETLKSGLTAWQQDAVEYYRNISALHPASRYIASASRAHLYQFAEVKSLIELINNLN
jgi:pimeloyl-ACP methyl ester carboxylesterase